MSMLFVNRGKTLASTLMLALLVTHGALAADALKTTAAPQGPVQKVAVLDMAAALFNSDSAKAIEQEILKQTGDDQTKIRSLADEGKKIQDKLKKDEAVMSDDDKRKQQERLQELNVQYQFLAEKIQKLMQDRRQQFQEKYQQNLVAAISEVMKEGNYDMVLRSEAVLFIGSNVSDITAKVTEKLNKQK